MLWSKNAFTTLQGATLGVRDYTQNMVILFRDATKKALYLGGMRIGNAQGRFGYCLCDPLHGDTSLRHYLSYVLAKFQFQGFGWHGINVAYHSDYRVPYDT